MKYVSCFMFIMLSGCGVSSYDFYSNIGPQGVAGITGAAGSQGATGTTGLMGSVGATGQNGTNGSVGANGASGAKGSTGSSGVQGNTGSTGASGSQGATGASGSNGNGFNSGLSCDVYSVQAADETNNLNWLKLFSDGVYKFTFTTPNLNVANQSNLNTFPGFTASEQTSVGNTNYALDCNGFLDVPEYASYSFNLGSDDGSQLSIDNTTIINMNQDQAYSSMTATGVVLTSGLHKVNVVYFQGPAVMIGLTLSWQGDANQNMGSMSVIPTSALSH